MDGRSLLGTLFSQNKKSENLSKPPHHENKHPHDVLSFKVAKLTNEKNAFENGVRIAASYQLEQGVECVANIISKNNNTSIFYPVIFDANIIDQNKIEMSAVVRDDLGYKINDDVRLSLSSNSMFYRLDHVCLEIQKTIPNSPNIKLNTSILEHTLRNQISGSLLNNGQALIIPYNDGQTQLNVVVKVVNIDQTQDLNPAMYYFGCDDKIFLSTDQHAKVDLVGNIPKTFSLDFKAKGVGGHKKQIERLIREGFYSRLLPNQYADAYDIKPCTGILLYGPPGTGKTLIARVISEFFPHGHVKIVNGPELKNKYVGESQANLRRIFNDAEIDWILKGNNSDLHVIVFDEIDALCPKRGSRSGTTGVDDDMVSSLLTIIDGMNSPKNILVIGMTNRKELLDPALLRPGRLDLQIEINLPDQAGRLEIFEIKTKVMRQNGLLDQRIDLQHWARVTQNFSGAEIEYLVKKAGNYAMGDNFDATTTELKLKANIKNPKQLAKITQDHFVKAFAEITPAFGKDNQYGKLSKNNFVEYTSSLRSLIDQFALTCEQVTRTEILNYYHLLLSGNSGTGKTALAIHLAKMSGTGHIKVLSPDMFLGMTLEKKLEVIQEEFDHAKQVASSVIILDDFEGLLGADIDCQTYNNDLRLKYEAVLKMNAESQNKCVVIATTKHKEFIEHLQLLNLFNDNEVLNEVNLQYSSECVGLLTQFSQPLGYKFLPMSYSQEETQFSLPIRELLYRLKQFCADSKNLISSHPKEIDCRDFYKFLTDIDSGKTPTNVVNIPNRFFEKKSLRRM